MDLLYKADSVKTFENEVYKLNGTMAVNRSNGEICPVSTVYYNVRTAIDKRRDVVAKRKNANEELAALK